MKPVKPDPERVAKLAASLISKGVHPSLADQMATDILIMHPEGGNIRVTGTLVEIRTLK